MALCHYEPNYDSHIFCAVLQNRSPVGDSFNRPYIIRNKGYFVDCIYMVLIYVMKKILIIIKIWFLNHVKKIWELNREAKLGLLLLVPPIIASINYLERDFSHYTEVDVFHLQPGIMKISLDSALNMEPIFYGLLALAGASLIKGNLGK